VAKKTVDLTRAVEGRSPGKLAWDRFRQDRVAMVSLVFLGIILLTVAAAPLITGYFNVDPYSTDETAIDINNFGYPYGPWAGASWEHPLGVEPGTGRDIMARLLYGARISLLIATITAVLSIGIGVIAGLISGYFRGRTDAAIGRLVDFLLAFPSLFLIIALSRPMADRLQEFLGTDDRNFVTILLLIILLAVLGWASIARIIRAEVLSLREREFVLAASSLGASHIRIIFKELLPSLWPKALVFLSLSLPGFLTTEAVLSFLGVGIRPPHPTWGWMLQDSVRYFKNATVPAYFLFPGITLVVIVILFNLVSTGVNDALDPKIERNK
jgi:peptide/nickel transport system permease protein